MDTIAFRLPYRKSHALKIRKATLAKILIIAELIGIAIFAWQLRAPLYKKYFAVKPKAYSLTTFAPQKNYLLSESDFLVGQAPPDTKIKLIFNPGRHKRTVKTSAKGNWVSQLPKSLSHRRYSMTMASFDTQNKLTAVTSYKTRVQTENLIGQTPIFKNFIRPILLRTANAQQSLETLPEFQTWVDQLQVLGVYPYCETNAEPSAVCTESSIIMLTNAPGYESVCQRISNCRKSDNASSTISPLVDTTIIQSLNSTSPIPYLRPVSDYLDNLVTPPSTTAQLNEDLLNTPLDEPNEEEKVLLLSQDGKETPYIPYVDLSQTPQSE
jgi:hypothetical protein